MISWSVIYNTDHYGDRAGDKQLSSRYVVGINEGERRVATFDYFRIATEDAMRIVAAMNVLSSIATQTLVDGTLQDVADNLIAHHWATWPRGTT